MHLRALLAELACAAATFQPVSASAQAWPAKPIRLMAVSPYLLVVHPSLPAKTLAEFIALAKAQPGKLNYASAGIGSTTHLAMEMLKSGRVRALAVGTPQPIIDRLNKEVVALVGTAEMREAIAKAGAEPISSTPAELAATIRDGVARYAQIIKAAGIKPE